MTSEDLFSTIKPTFKKRLMMKAILCAAVGSSIMVGTGTFASIEILDTWGIPIFAVGIFLIAWGMIPYRKLSSLEEKPLRIELFEKSFSFTAPGKLCEIIKYDEVVNLEYTETKNRYGIVVYLKDRSPLFLPYFSNDSFKCLKGVF